MTDIYLVGNGRHAAVVAEIAGKYLRLNGGGLVYYTTLDGQAHFPGWTEADFYGSDDDLLSAFGGGMLDDFIIGIGDNKKRAERYKEFCKYGRPTKAIAHSNAYVSSRAEIGSGTIIMPGAIIGPNARIGANCIINHGAQVDHDCIIHDHAHIGPGAILCGSVTVGEGAFVGAGATIIPDIKIGAWTLVRAGKTVTASTLDIVTYTEPSDANKIKTLIYAPVVGRGGVARLVERLTGAWAEADLEKWEFIALSQPRDEHGNPIHWPCEFIQLEPAKAPTQPDLFAYLLNFQRIFYNHFKKVIAERHIDLVWLPMPWWSMRVPDFHCDVPIVCTIPDFAFDFIRYLPPDMQSAYRAEAQALSRNCAHACFPSDFHRRHAEDEYRFQSTSTIHYGHFLPKTWDASPKAVERVRAKYNLPDRYNLMFGCTPHKDPKTVVQAHALARNRSANVPVLVLAGLDSDTYKPDVKSAGLYQADVRRAIEAERYRHGRDLFVLGFIPDEDIGGLYGGAGSVVSASTSEGGLSATLFEGIESQTPLIFSNLEVFTERLGYDSEYGLCFPTRSIIDLAQCIVDVYEQPIAARDRAANAYRDLRDRTWQAVAGDYLRTFRQIVEREKANA